MNKPTLVIMAAGMGSRYGGLKQIDPVGPNNEIIIDYSIHDAIEAGFGKVVFIIRKDFEQDFRNSVGKRTEKKIDTAYCFQSINDLPSGFTVPEGRTKPWGTGHAILSCKGTVTTPFAAINADDFYGKDAYRVMAEYLAAAKDKPGAYDYSMVGYILKNTLTENGHVSRGVCEVENGYMKIINERKYIQRFDNEIKFSDDGQNWTPVSGDKIVSMSFWGFTQSVIDELSERFPRFLKNNINIPKSEFYLPIAVGDIVRDKKATVKVLSSSARWFGVTYHEDREALQKAILNLIEQGEYPEKL